ncbi:MAG: four helix bundle protein, partial [Bacteroidota bacterium]
MRDFKKFTIWNNGIDIVASIYKFTKQLPSEEKFGLISQMCRAAVSIPSNIAEGCSRNSEVEFKRFLEIALGSSFELETQILTCERLGFISSLESQKIILPLNELQKQINSLITKIKDNNRQ